MGKGGVNPWRKKSIKNHTLLNDTGASCISKVFLISTRKNLLWGSCVVLWGRKAPYKTLAFRSMGEEAGSCMEISFNKPPNNQLLVSPIFFSHQKNFSQ